MSRQSPVIKLAQHSKWTHCGIVFHIGGKAYVYEAVEPVKYTPLKDWIARGKNGVYCAKRLKTPLTIELCTPSHFSDYPITAPAVQKLI